MLSEGESDKVGEEGWISNANDVLMRLFLSGKHQFTQVAEDDVGFFLEEP